MMSPIIFGQYYENIINNTSTMYVSLRGTWLPFYDHYFNKGCVKKQSVKRLIIHTKYPELTFYHAKCLLVIIQVAYLSKPYT